MPTKNIHVKEIGNVKISKRKGLKSIKLSVDHNGDTKLNIPYWVSLKSGLNFLYSNIDWITSQRKDKLVVFRSDQTVAKRYKLKFIREDCDKVLTSTTDSLLIIKHPKNIDYTSTSVQLHARKLVHNVLRDETESQIFHMLRELSSIHNLPFKSVSTRALKTRWGSCSSTKHITLNIFLTQLPEHLIQYVLIHELVHTKHMNHSPEFWKYLFQILPSSNDHKKEIKNYKPSILIA